MKIKSNLISILISQTKITVDSSIALGVKLIVFSYGCLNQRNILFNFLYALAPLISLLLFWINLEKGQHFKVQFTTVNYKILNVRDVLKIWGEKSLESVYFSCLYRDCLIGLLFSWKHIQMFRCLFLMLCLLLVSFL